MQRRQFLRTLPAVGLAAVGAGTWQNWPRPGLTNPCLAELPEQLAQHPLLRAVWDGLDATQVWDCHVHLVGAGDSGSEADENKPWFSPEMDSFWHPILKLQKLFYLNAGCVHETPGQMDASYIDRMLNLIAGMKPGFKAMLFAFDWNHDESGQPRKEHSIFFIPNAYAAMVAHQHPESFEWVASVHPYRKDAADALQQAAEQGARAIKWLPSAMGIDPLSARCDRFYQAAADLKLPIISHAGRELAVQGGTQDFGNPLRLRRALDHGVRVVIAHCASDGDDQDTDQGADGPRVKSYELFARMMDESQYGPLLYADISALTQRNRAWALKSVMARRDWHSRLLNGSDYPLPGIMPLFEPADMADQGLLQPEAVSLLEQVRGHNPLLFDFACKRMLRLNGQGFPAGVFETRRFFDREATA